MTNDREKRTMKRYLATAALGLIPGIAFAWIVGQVLDISVWKTWIWIQIILLLKDAFVAPLEYVAYRFIWRNDMVDDVSESLSTADYPNPKKYHYNTLAEHYFGSVMQDEDLKIGTRLEAAYVLGSMSAQHGWLNQWRLNSMMSGAISKYHRIKFGGNDYTEEMLVAD